MKPTLTKAILAIVELRTKLTIPIRTICHFHSSTMKIRIHTFAFVCWKWLKQNFPSLKKKCNLYTFVNLKQLCAWKVHQNNLRSYDFDLEDNCYVKDYAPIFKSACSMYELQNWDWMANFCMLHTWKLLRYILFVTSTIQTDWSIKVSSTSSMPLRLQKE